MFISLLKKLEGQGINIFEIKSNESGWKRPNETFFIKENGCEVHGGGAHWLHTVHRSRLWSNMRTDAALRVRSCQLDHS